MSGRTPRSRPGWVTWLAGPAEWPGSGVGGSAGECCTASPPPGRATVRDGRHGRERPSVGARGAVRSRGAVRARVVRARSVRARVVRARSVGARAVRARSARSCVGAAGRRRSVVGSDAVRRVRRRRGDRPFGRGRACARRPDGRPVAGDPLGGRLGPGLGARGVVVERRPAASGEAAALVSPSRPGARRAGAAPGARRGWRRPRARRRGCRTWRQPSVLAPRRAAVSGAAGALATPSVSGW